MLWGFAFDDDNGQAVEEQYNVGEDVVFGAENADFELGYGCKPVVGEGVKVDEADGWVFFACFSVFGYGGVF